MVVVLSFLLGSGGVLRGGDFASPVLWRRAVFVARLLLAFSFSLSLPHALPSLVLTPVLLTTPGTQQCNWLEAWQPTQSGWEESQRMQLTSGGNIANGLPPPLTLTPGLTPPLSHLARSRRPQRHPAQALPALAEQGRPLPTAPEAASPKRQKCMHTEVHVALHTLPAASASTDA